MTDEEIQAELVKFSEILPHFPDGRIDYSTSDTAPVITVFVRHNGKILLLKRSNEVAHYKGMWNTVAGYLDELRPVREKVLEELREELGITEESIASIAVSTPFSYTDPSIGKTWLIHSVLVELKEEPAIQLDFEHTTYRWIIPEEIGQFTIIPGLDKNLAHALALS